MTKQNPVENHSSAAARALTDLELHIDLDGYQLRQGRKRRPLTRLERETLALLLRSGGRILSRNEILDSVWGRNTEVDLSSVDNIIARVRSKFRSLQTEREWIETVRGKGYRWTGVPAASDHPANP